MKDGTKDGTARINPMRFQYDLRSCEGFDTSSYLQLEMNVIYHAKDCNILSSILSIEGKLKSKSQVMLLSV